MSSPEKRKPTRRFKTLRAFQETRQKGSPNALTAGGSHRTNRIVHSDDGYPGRPTAPVISRSLHGCDECSSNRRELEIDL
jgi:hypothetical protein